MGRWSSRYWIIAAGLEAEGGLDGSSRSLSSGIDCGAVGINHDGQRVGQADGVGHLDFAALGQTRRPPRSWPHDGACKMWCGRPWWGLCREGAAAVIAPAAVGVHDDLPAGDAAVRQRAAHDKPAGGVHQELGVHQQMVRDRLFDHFLNDGFFQILQICTSGPCWAAITTAWTLVGMPLSYAAPVTRVLPSGRRNARRPSFLHLGQTGRQAVGKQDGHGHQSGESRCRHTRTSTPDRRPPVHGRPVLRRRSRFGRCRSMEVRTAAGFPTLAENCSRKGGAERPSSCGPIRLRPLSIGHGALPHLRERTRGNPLGSPPLLPVATGLLAQTDG